jgi:O-antigen/teichoic acid export membrane protein
VTPADEALPATPPGAEAFTVARNVSTRYLAIGIEIVLGLVVLPFNVAHLGKAAYGLWMLTASVTAYFSILDLGYSGAIVKFVAQYRSRRDARALNEILSTMFFLFAAFGTITYGVAIAIAMHLDRLFHVTPDQVHVGQLVLLIISLNVAMGMAFSVFGGVINGFQRYDLNNLVGTISSLVTAAVNVAVLDAGYGLVELVAATTAVRLLTYFVYRSNAYRVFPALRIRAGSFRIARLREVTFFSVYILLIDWANKVNYSVDALVIGAFLSTSAVAVWTVGQRLAEVTQRLTNQLNDMLFPMIVDNDAAARADRLRSIFVQGTRLSLAAVVPLGGTMMLMAGPLVRAWVGPDFGASVLVLRLLTCTVIVRVGNSTATTLLKGAGQHRLVAFTNGLAAIVNLAVSMAAVKPLGLAGVALGTLIPVCLAATIVVFPAGCRRVQMTTRRAFTKAVWPAVWPASVMTAYILATRDLVPETLPAVGAEMCAGVLVYAIVFMLFGISARERRLYVSQVSALILQRPAHQPVPEGA